MNDARERPRMPTPDLIVIARHCHTFATRPRGAEALAIAEGRVVALGPARTLLRARGASTRVLNLPHTVVTPGLVDSHTHLYYWALGTQLVIDVTGLPTLDTTLVHLHSEQMQRRVGDWVLGRGFDQNRWQRDFPTARELDRAIPNAPAMVRARDGHTAWLNTAALRLLNITARTPDPPGGRYLRDHRGRPTGIVQESAVDNLPSPLRDFGLCTETRAARTIDRALQAAYRTAWSLGITGVCCMDDAPSLTHFQRQRQNGTLGLRVTHAIPLGELDAAISMGLRSGLGDDWLRLGAVKIFVDGALGSQTAYMYDTYPDQAGFHGVALLAGDELEHTVVKAAQHGWAVWIHAIGDHAVHDAISAIAAARRVEHMPLPHRIEHVQCIRAADVRRMAKHRIVASVQPCHIIGDISTADRHWPKARRRTYAFRDLLEAGVPLCLGSDVPIESIDPRRSLFGATMRTDTDLQPDGGWFPIQRLTTEEALRGFTRGAAEGLGLPLPHGTLAVGAPADLTVWDEDPLRAKPADLLSLPIAGCVVGGKPHLRGEA
ncbi:MAG: amidohydrolase [Phycisphaerae bacterium]|nr:amidohydrolase [Phycisphaerae bacterium]